MIKKDVTQAEQSFTLRFDFTETLCSIIRMNIGVSEKDKMLTIRIPYEIGGVTEIRTYRCKPIPTSPRTNEDKLLVLLFKRNYSNRDDPED